MSLSPTDLEIAEAAEREAEAQLKIVRMLKPFSSEKRERILNAMALLLEAEQLVPGILDVIRRKVRRKAA
jgi:hypothetical protein